MRATDPLTRCARRRPLLTGCALSALLAAGWQPAGAQSFNGTPTVVAGDAVFNNSPDQTLITLLDNETVINWQTVDTLGSGAIEFQAAGTAAIFESLPGFSDYTVLNRILPVDTGGAPTAATVAFNGSVTSLLGNNPGGHIFFYSPTGIIVGPNATFNVGSLILTTNDIQFVPGASGGGSIYGPGGLLEFRGPADSTGYVDIQPGAQLSATGASAYLAVVAPRVVQQGEVLADGQIAYIAAEQIDMTIGTGLFDFTITVGTTDANGVVHTGVTSGPASQNVFDNQRVAIVALPKNDALTMLLSGSIGYEPALSATDEGSTIVLSAGWDRAEPAGDADNRLGSIEIGSATFRNRLTAYASGDADILPAGGSVEFEDVAVFRALGDIDVVAGAGAQIVAATDLALHADDINQGGNILLRAEAGGTIDIGGRFAATVDADAFFGFANAEAFGGTVTIVADDGAISMLEGFIDAGAAAPYESFDARNGTGGMVDISVANGGSLSVDTILSINASGDATFISVSEVGAVGAGGEISLNVTNGSASFGFLSLDSQGTGGRAAGTGGEGQGGTIAVELGVGGVLSAETMYLSSSGSGGGGGAFGGDGAGGAVLLSATGGQFEIGSLSLDVRAGGGTGSVEGGDGIGGDATISLTGGTHVFGDLFANSNTSPGGPAVETDGLYGSASGGSGLVQLLVSGAGTSLTINTDAEFNADAYMLANGRAGFTGQAGDIALEITNGASLEVLGTLTVQANAVFDADIFDPVISTPTQIGGAIDVVADGGSISAQSLLVRADAYGLAASTTAGGATGGAAQVAAIGGGSIAIGDGSSGNALISASAFGQSGPNPSNAQGGAAAVLVEDGTFTVSGSLEVSASGLMAPDTPAASAGTGFSATGGLASLTLAPGALGNASFSANEGVRVLALGDARMVSVSSTPPYGDPLTGDAGDGQGGTARISVGAGFFEPGSVEILSHGYGGGAGPAEADPPYLAGDGIGGSSTFTQSGGLSTISTLDVRGDGFGGASATEADSLITVAATAGNGIGGDAGIVLSGGALDVSVAARIGADGTGGVGMNHTDAGQGGQGGNGAGGTALVSSSEGWAGNFFTPALIVTANGLGGTGGESAGGTDGQGGDGTGATALADLHDGAFALGEVTLGATGTGGNGGTGGTGSGGAATFSVIDTVGGDGRSLASLLIETNGLAGLSGGVFPEQSQAGDIAVIARVADAESAIAINGSLELYSMGGFIGAPSQIAIDVAGAPLAVSGSVIVDVTGDIAIDAAQAVRAGSDIFISTERSVAATGLIHSDGQFIFQGGLGVSAERLAAVGPMFLGYGGPVVVSVDLSSTGLVTAYGDSIDIVSLGALSFASLEAASGPLSVVTAGNLTLPGVTAPGAVTLRSTGGALSASGAIDAGGAVIAAGATEVTLPTVVSGSTTQLQSSGGAISVGSLTSPGLVTASGASVNLASPGSLAFAGLSASAGAITVATANALTLGAATTASGAISLSAGSGVLTSAGPITAGGAVSVIAPGGIDLATLTSGGTTLLRSTGGDVAVDALSSAGLVTALGETVSLISPAALAFADLDATAGDLLVTATGNLALASTDATGSVTLRSTGGALTASGAVNAGGPVIAAGATGVNLPTLVSGGATQLNSGGAIAIASLTSPGAVTASGASVDLASPGSLAFADLDATAGNLVVTTAGALALATADAAGALTLRSTGGALSASGAVNAGGAVIAAGAGGVTLPTLASGGTTLLQSSGGAISIASLTSSGAVTALGRSISLAGPGALTFADLDATAGDLLVTAAGNLALATTDAAGAVTLRSTGGALTASGPVNAGGAVIVAGATGVALPTLVSSGTTQLNSGGAISVANLSSAGAITASGASIDLASPGSLAFAGLTSTVGALDVTSVGSLTLTGADAAGALSLRSTGGAVSSSGPIDAGGAVVLSGPAGVTVPMLTSGGTTQLQSATGDVVVNLLASAGPVSVSGRGVAIDGLGALTFTTAEAAAAMTISADGDLTLASADAQLDLTLISGGTLTVTGNARGLFGSLTAAEDIVVGGDLSAGGNLSVNAGGAFTAAGSTFTGDATIVADGGIAMARLSTGEITRLQASAGNVVVSELVTGGSIYANGRDIDIASTGGLSFVEAIATAGDVDIVAAGDLRGGVFSASGLVALESTGGSISTSNGADGQAISLIAAADVLAGADLAATDLLTVDAGGTFALEGEGTGREIHVRSTDIVLGSAAALGAREVTRDIVLLNGDPARTMFVGGAAESAGYSLDAAEAARLFSDVNIFIGLDLATPVAPGEGNIAIRDLALAFGATANLGAGGMLEISTPGEILIAGDVALTTASADDRFLIDPTLIELDTDAGSIAMLDSAGNPLGQLGMVGGRVVVASADVLGAIRSGSDFAAINTALGNPGGGAQPLRAGALTFDVQDGLFIQNTGVSDRIADRRGFTAGSVAILTADASTRIAINGQILGPSGAVGGLETAPLILINGAPAAAGGQFDPASTVNGCVIGATCFTGTRPGETPPTSNDLERPPLAGEAEGSQFVAPLIELAGTDPLITPPLVDEPITGVGNDDLWEPRCDPDEEACPGPDTPR